MKFLSVLLIACMLFLPFAGLVKPVTAAPVKKDCCQRMAGIKGKATCSNKPADQNKGCDKQGCTMMLSCSICGFFGVEPLRFQPVPAKYVAKPVSLYKIGSVSAYHSSDWKPPKTC